MPTDLPNVTPTAAELLAALPQTLGYHPREAILLLRFRGPELTSVSEFTAHTPFTAATSGIDYRAYEQPTHAVLVAVADRHATASRRKLTLLRRAVEIAGTPVVAALQTSRIEAGQWWSQADGTAWGVVPNPQPSLPVANDIRIKTAANPYTLIGDDAQIATATRAALIAQQRQPSAFGRTTMLEVLALIQAGQAPGLELAARVAVLIGSDAGARAALTSLARYPGARHFACALAARTRGTARGHLLAVVALLAYCDADWAGVRDALDLAHAETSPQKTPPLLRLLTSAYRVAVPPSQAQPMCDFGQHMLAAKFGIELDTYGPIAA